MTMRKSMIVLSAVLGLAAAPTGGHATHLPVSGEVTKVDESAGKITIKHGPITKFDMDGMTMVFRANDPAMLGKVKPGDKIKFDVDKINGQFTVTEIEKGK
jgi:Cu(I)/Ag(I) efflux system periplasmic protein CusF